jgi:hypothetical protein
VKTDFFSPKRLLLVPAWSIMIAVAWTVPTYSLLGAYLDRQIPVDEDVVKGTIFFLWIVVSFIVSFFGLTLGVAGLLPGTRFRVATETKDKKAAPDSATNSA